MRDKKNIDRLFKEKLKAFEATPSDSVWENISTKLQNLEKGKKASPILWKVAGVAAAFLLLFTISQLVLNNNNNTTPSQETIVDVDSEDSINGDLKKDNNKENTITNTEQKNVSEDLNPQSSSVPSNSSVANTVITPVQNDNLLSESVNKNVTVNDKPQNDNTSIINKNELVNPSSNQTKNAIADNTDSTLSIKKVENSSLDKVKIDELLNPANNNASETKETVETTLINNSVDESITESEESNAIIEEGKLSITEEIAANEEENVEDITDEEFERWKAASNIAPVYFNTFGKGSSIHPQFNNNSKTGNINMSYGITASYAINKKLSIRSGVSKVNLGYSTDDVVVYNNIGGSDNPLLRNVKLNEAGQNLSFISIDEFNFIEVPGILNNFIESSIDQKLGFIEIPLELEYRISNKKMGINLIGGFSALFLTNNEIYSVLNGDSTLLGEATNINNTSFSANFGLGFDFKISDKFNLNFEPVFKYQLNTFNNTSGNFKPFFIGVYSGLSFKF